MHCTTAAASDVALVSSTAVASAPRLPRRSAIVRAMRADDEEEDPNGPEAGTRFLAENRKKKDVIACSSGLQYRVIKEGDGLVRPGLDTKCACHYVGALLDGTQFDSSYEKGRPSTFRPDQVIKGWTEAMTLMATAGVRETVDPAVP